MSLLKSKRLRAILKSKEWNEKYQTYLQKELDHPLSKKDYNREKILSDTIIGSDPRIVEEVILLAQNSKVVQKHFPNNFNLVEIAIQCSMIILSIEKFRNTKGLYRNVLSNFRLFHSKKDPQLIFRLIGTILGVE